jgi:hypothetical protein
MIDDCDVILGQNTINKNRKSGVVSRNQSRAKMKDNSFHGNEIDLVVENDHEYWKNVEEENEFTGDIRMPKNYKC